MAGKTMDRHFPPALDFEVGPRGDAYDILMEQFGFNDYIDTGFGADVYDAEELEGAASLALVYQNVPAGHPYLDGVEADYILLCADGRLAWPNRLAGMVLFTERSDWTGCEAAMKLAHSFQTMEAEGTNK